jgi:hypothetical protein
VISARCVEIFATLTREERDALSAIAAGQTGTVSIAKLGRLKSLDRSGREGGGTSIQLGVPNVKITKENKRHAAYVAQSCRCFYCTAPMWERSPDQFALNYGITLRQARLLCCTAEHLEPKSEGGSNAAGNIAAACLHCNRTRHRAHKPLAPHAYLRLVRSRVARGRWLPNGLSRLCRKTP